VAKKEEIDGFNTNSFQQYKIRVKLPFF
jgi:hypothetical protein